MDILNWSDWQAVSDKTEAETQLVENSLTGLRTVLGEGDRPLLDSPARRVRAELLRYLVLGGCPEHPVSVRGIELSGAWVEGSLDLDFAVAKGATRLQNCTFPRTVHAQQTTFEVLNLEGSMVQGLKAGGCQVKGSFLLNNGFTARASVDIAGSVIGGQLHCDGAVLDGDGNVALDAQAVQVTGSALLRNGFTAHGPVTMTAAKIGGSVDCTGALLDFPDGLAITLARARVGGSVLFRDGFEARGEIRLVSADVQGGVTFSDAEFFNPQGIAINAVRLRVAQTLIFKAVTVAAGSVTFAETQCGALSDDVASWPTGTDELDTYGMTYGRITEGFLAYRERRDWLRVGAVNSGEFRPQPFVQLARVLSDMGHDRDARRIKIEQKRLSDAFAQLRLRQDLPRPIAPLAKVVRPFTWLWSLIQRVTVGYGFAPWRSIGALALLLLIATTLGHNAWISGGMAPNSALILQSEAWQSFSEGAQYKNPAAQWSCAEDREDPLICPPVGRDWETFNRYAYAVDLVVPIINLGQTDAWAPSTSRGKWGWHFWWSRWILAGLGWVVTALAAAAVTGIIQKD